MSDKPVTVVELKTFIDAVEFAADVEEWIPSPRQWKRIRDMIDKLETAPAYTAAPPMQMPQIPMNQPALPAFGVPSNPGMPPQLAGPSFASQMPSGTMPTPPQGLRGPFAGASPQMPVRTPDIDSTNGYTSTFAD